MQTDPRRECVGEQVSFRKLAVVLPYSQNIQKHQEDLKDHSALFQPAVLSIHVSMPKCLQRWRRAEQAETKQKYLKVQRIVL